ncbi:MAG: prephenate dehydrogenase [Actinomycetota bacterium]
MKKLHIRIVGAGLIGTSIALGAAQQGHTVELDDTDPTSRRLAEDLLRPHLSQAQPDLVVVATPPQRAFATLLIESESNPQSTFIDVASVKNNLLHDVEALPALAERFIGTHPMAGREVSGPSSAQGDLFNGRAWIVVPTSRVAKSHLDLVTSFIESLGATPYLMNGSEHDRLLARISHLPQILSTTLASSISEANKGLELSGQGLRDMTRLANSDGALWSEILLENSAEVLKAIDDFNAQIATLRSAISGANSAAIREIFRNGNSGREKVSGKHGAQPRNYVHLLVVIKDEPGALRQLFDECAQVHANIEDLSIEHSPQQETGLITLAFSPDDARKVEAHLKNGNWKVHSR